MKRYIRSTTVRYNDLTHGVKYKMDDGSTFIFDGVINHNKKHYVTDINGHEIEIDPLESFEVIDTNTSANLKAQRTITSATSDVASQLKAAGYTRSEIQQIKHRLDSGWTLDAAMQEFDPNIDDDNLEADLNASAKYTTQEVQNDDGSWSLIADHVDIAEYYYDPEHPFWYRRPYREDGKYFYDMIFGKLYRYEKV